VIAGITLRHLKLADIPAVEQVERRSYPTPWSRTMFAGEIEKPTSRCYGAFDGDRLAGYLIVSRYVDAWHVMNVAIDEPYRRRGLAEQMLRQLIADTDGDGTRGYTLEVRVSNHGAIRLYERIGFTPTGIRRGYYTDNREDALIMWREGPPDGA
jgi:[ribosomal protein S18]-alanine N-acetyltransferase